MVGLVIVCHGNLGSELVKVAEIIVGKIENVESVSIGSVVDVDHSREQIDAAIKRLYTPDGIVILTDMFGGTPSNLALSFLDEERKIEIITGVNLPMVIRFSNHRKDKPLRELVQFIRDGALKSVIIASEMLHAKAKK